MTRGRAFALVAASYVAGGLGAWAAIALYPGPSTPLALVAVGDLAATLVVFGFSVVFRNTSFYDAYWSVAPMAIAPYLWFGFEGEAITARQALVTALVMAWGARLTYNWARGWTGLEHEDWRYVDMRKKTGVLFPLVNLFGLQLFPTVLVYLGCLPLLAALVTGDAPLGPLDAVAALVTLGATVIEGVSDNQLRAFVKSRPAKGTVLDQGLWSWSRHPNYFGEMAFWCGLALFGFAAGERGAWLLIGPGAMIFLFVVVSIPMMERRQIERRPRYLDYKKRVSMVIPRPPRKADRAG